MTMTLKLDDRDLKMLSILGEEGRIAWSGPATELSGDRELIHTHLGL